MPEARPASDYASWDPRAYLRQYYAAIGSDELANARFVRETLGRLGRPFATAVEFGCGPTIHHAAMLAPFVRSLHLVDYLEANLDEVRRWLRADPAAFDWDAYLAGLLADEGLAGHDAVVARAALVRRVVSATGRGDLTRSSPLDGNPTYDLVASFYCVEAVASTRPAWARYLANLARLVAPGGVLLLGAVRRCEGYQVFERTYPSARIDEADFAALLPRLGFAAARTETRVVAVPDLVEQGFDSICCVCASKDGARR